MQYRQFGNTDLKVSEIGFGAWAIGGGTMIGNTSIGWGDTDDTVSVKAIQAALDAGINFLIQQMFTDSATRRNYWVTQSEAVRTLSSPLKWEMCPAMNSLQRIIPKNIF